MSLDEKFIPIRTGFYQMVESLLKKIAGLFGYPENPGMSTVYNFPNEAYARSNFLENLRSHRTFWPPIQRPETWFETIFGPSPKIDAVPKYLYENREEGFYNFYIENYKNIYFLPDWLSEFLQVRLNFCFDITLLESIREVVFIGLVIYSQIVILRITLSWFISINPYKVPWSYLVAAVDWTEEVLQGVVPAILGVNITGTIFLGILGVLADSLNHLVFTMPFLPSEAEESNLVFQQETKDVLVFHYLPILWYRYPIPNEIREFWYNERPEILDYMQKAYKDLDIQFLPDSLALNQIQAEVRLNDLKSTLQYPDSVAFKDELTLDYLGRIAKDLNLETQFLFLQDLSQEQLKLTSDFPLAKNNYLTEILSTEILSTKKDEFLPYFHWITEHFDNFWITN